MTGAQTARPRVGAFESPRAFSRLCTRLAIALTILGIAGLVERVFVLPLAGLLFAFALLAKLAESERLDDPDPDPEPEPDPALATVDTVATVERTFRLPSSVGAERAWLVGEFNGWSRTAHPMARDGEWFTAVVPLETGRAFRYRYLLDGVRWENDWDADGYLPNDFGSDDSVART